MKVISVFSLVVALASAADETTEVARELQTLSVTDYTATCYGGRYVISHAQYSTTVSAWQQKQSCKQSFLNQFLSLFLN